MNSYKDQIDVYLTGSGLFVALFNIMIFTCGTHSSPFNVLNRCLKGWFCGFKLHLIVNHQGGIVEARLTPANAHDTKPVNEIVRSGMVKLYGDKGYINQALSDELLAESITLVICTSNSGHLTKHCSSIQNSLG